jgi:hypothetical protein
MELGTAGLAGILQISVLLQLGEQLLGFAFDVLRVAEHAAIV